MATRADVADEAQHINCIVKQSFASWLPFAKWNQVTDVL
jgi:hypothetical protein